MPTLFIQSWFSDPIARAIGWTLVHSLWQGLLLTFIAGILVMMTKRSAAAIRYKLLSFLLIAFVATTCITFVIQLQVSTPTAIELLETRIDNADRLLDQRFADELLQPITVQPISFFDEFTGYVNNHAALIVTIWLIIFFFKCVRLTANIGYAYRMRQHKSSALPALQKRVAELAAIMKIKGAVLIRESGIIKVPSVIGYLKPVILLPIGLLSNLPADQVEAIILHELAHIRRKDYLVNLFQCFAETVFFFNPSVLWLSSLIRQERENCCDDMAIAIIGKKVTYIHALVAFQEYNANSLCAPAFPGQKYPILQRVRRIVHNSNKNLSNMEKTFLAIGLVLSTVLVLAFSSTSAQEPAPVTPPVTAVEKAMPVTLIDTMMQLSAIVKDTPPEQKKTIRLQNVRVTGKPEKIKQPDKFDYNDKEDNKKLKEVRIENDEKGKKEGKIESAKAEYIKIENARAVEKKNDREFENSTKSDKRFMLKSDSDWSIKYKERNFIRNKLGNAAEKQVDAKEAQIRKLEDLLEKYKDKWKDRPATDEDMEALNKEINKVLNGDKRHKGAVLPNRPKPERVKEGERPKRTKTVTSEVVIDNGSSTLILSNSSSSNMDEQTKKINGVVTELKTSVMTVKEQEKIKKSIVDDILRNDLFQNEKFLVVALNYRSMRINGKIQSDAVHEQFRKKYIKSEGEQIFLNLK